MPAPVVHTDFPFIFAANQLKRLSRVRRPAENRPNLRALYSQMKPLLAIPSRVISEKRAAAARANGAKSRGPVTAIGKANSSRNSRRHGLRSRILFADPESAGQLNDLLASFERLLQPQSEIERTLIGTMALIALAFRSMIDHGCSLQIINRLESRCERQYDRAADRLNALRAHGIFKKINIHERTQEVVENTAPHPALTHSATVSTAESQSVGNPNHKKITRERKYGTLDR